VQHTREWKRLPPARLKRSPAARSGHDAGTQSFLNTSQLRPHPIFTCGASPVRSPRLHLLHEAIARNARARSPLIDAFRSSLDGTPTIGSPWVVAPPQGASLRDAIAPGGGPTHASVRLHPDPSWDRKGRLVLRDRRRIPRLHRSFIDVDECFIGLHRSFICLHRSFIRRRVRRGHRRSAVAGRRGPATRARREFRPARRRVVHRRPATRRARLLVVRSRVRSRGRAAVPLHGSAAASSVVFLVGGSNGHRRAG
jgi:hypothetical protein